MPVSGCDPVYEKPFVASHSNARALVPDCPRDLTDDMIRALSERGGVAGINYFPPFLSAQDPKADRSAYQSRISDMIRHMEAYETSRRHPVHRSGI